MPNPRLVLGWLEGLVPTFLDFVVLAFQSVALRVRHAGEFVATVRPVGLERYHDVVHLGEQ